MSTTTEAGRTLSVMVKWPQKRSRIDFCLDSRDSGDRVGERDFFRGRVESGDRAEDCDGDLSVGEVGE